MSIWSKCKSIFKKNDDIKEENKRLREGIQRVAREIRREIDSRPKEPNMGKHGCLRRLEELLK